MTDTKDYDAKVPARVSRMERKRYEAWTGLAGSHGVAGTGETEQAAREALARNLAWIAHYVGAFVATDGAGQPWIVTVAYDHGHWIARRATEQGMSEGCTIMAAPSYSKCREEIATWNKPGIRWYHTGTGGGCTAEQADLPGGLYALLTDADRDACAPDESTTTFVIGLYQNADDGSNDQLDWHEGTRAECMAWLKAKIAGAYLIGEDLAERLRSGRKMPSDG